jgi:hypothetical protein
MMAGNPALVSLWNGLWFIPSFFPAMSNILMALSKKRVGMAVTTAANPVIGIFPDDRGCIGLGRLFSLPTNLFMIAESQNKVETPAPAPATTPQGPHTAGDPGSQVSGDGKTAEDPKAP